MDDLKADSRKSRRLAVYVHGKGGSAAEAAHYEPLCPGWDVIGFDYQAQTPWEARTEFPRFFAQQRRTCDTLLLIANSIGAQFALQALSREQVDRALFISPVVDMEKLIGNMMKWAGVTEAELCARQEIPTSFGETLSWQYLCDVRQHPILWHVPTCILYGAGDDLTNPGTIAAFADRTGAALTVMQEGEHWFHTPEQMQVLDHWVSASLLAWGLL